LEASWGRFGGVLGYLESALGLSWGGLGRLSASLGRPETVLERCGGLLGHLGGDFTGIKQFSRGMSSWKRFFIRIFVDLVSKNQAQKLKQSTNPIGKILFFAIRLF
jgi:hypothetical protein